MARYLIPARTSLIVLLSVCLITLLALPMIMPARALSSPGSPTAGELAVALHRVSLDAEALAASGISFSDVDDVVGAAALYLTDYGDALALADEACAAAKRQCDGLRRLIQSGQHEEGDLTTYNTAKTNLLTAIVQRDGLLDDLFDDVAAELTVAQRNTLTQIRTNRRWTMPMEFLVVQRAEADWIALRDALANERIADTLGEDPDATLQTLLGQLRAVTAVSTARANLDANLAAITAAWNIAVGL